MFISPRTGSASALLFALACGLAACSHGKPSEPPPQAQSMPAEDGPPAAEIKDIQHALNALGYDTGPMDGVAGPRTVKALRAFQKDQKLPEDAKVTTTLVKRLDAMRPEHPGALPAYQVGEVYAYTDGTREKVENVDTALEVSVDSKVQTKPRNYLIEAGPGLRADAPADFLQPLKVGANGKYRLFHQDEDGRLVGTTVVSCTVLRGGAVAVPAGPFRTLKATCRELGENGSLVKERRWYYAPSLSLVVREARVESGREVVMRDLIAVQPPTGAWPAAAHAGFDWAIVTALQDGPDAPISWSSTGVDDRYQIKVDSAPVDLQAALPGGTEGKPCFRYTLRRTDAKGPAKSYPAVACGAEDRWFVPGGTPYVFAAPPKGLRAASAAPTP